MAYVYVMAHAWRTSFLLWATVHDKTEIVGFYDGAWKADQCVEIFANPVSEEANYGDLVWYMITHLLLLSSYLRKCPKSQGKHCPIGSTVHTRFPAEDFWGALPVRKIY